VSFGRVLVPLAILTGMVVGLHYYLWARLVRDPAWGGALGRGLSLSIVVLAALTPLTFVAMRWLPRAWNAPLAWVAYVWMGLLLYLFLLTLGTDLGRGVAGVAGRLPVDPERRAWLARTIAAVVGAGSGLIGIGGVMQVARGFEVKHVRIPLARLPGPASGYAIVQLTDVHVGPTIGRDFVEQVVREANALSPDMIVITGDLVDGSVDQLRHLVEPLRNLVARDGVYFVTGNHEYYSGADEWIAHLRTLGIRVLRNERVAIRDAFDLAGVDDTSAHRMAEGHGQDVARALQGRDPSRAVVLLAHQPKAVRDARRADVDLQISGHVHGGQLVPFNWLVLLDQPFVSGLHQVDRTWVYVSAGTGYWGPPMRVGSRAEVTRIELVAAG
jgi:predicted MPP superfamily phosphohydrolase